MSQAVVALLLAALSVGPAASAATLAITPDRQTYRVGETITLDVIGDAEGASDSRVFGRLLFDPAIVTFVGASQVPLTSFDGSVIWTTGPLDGGSGFATAFNQVVSVNAFPVDGPLTASVSLLATAPGILDYFWQTEGDNNLLLDFFGLGESPGGSVSIVPEPDTRLLVALGLSALAGVARKRQRRRRGSSVALLASFPSKRPW